MSRIVVIGGGVTGLAAAYEAARLGADVVLLDADHRVGGKVRTSDLAGVAVDEAADAFLVRVPDALDLCRELGIDRELVSPAARRAYVYSRGALRVLPDEQLLGVPTDLDALAASGIVSEAAVARAARDLDEPGAPPDGDETVGAFVRRRLGDEVLERLVDPLVGGINAGDTDQLSLAATVPQLDATARGDEPSLMRACATARALADRDAPVFAAPAGGMGRLVDALADAVAQRSATIRTGALVTGLEVSGAGHKVHTDGGEALHADGVIVTTPPAAAAELLRATSVKAATILAGVPTASVVLVGLAVPRGEVDHPLDGSGFLVPRPEGRLLTACTWASSKWAHLAGDGATVLLRASAGRFGDDRLAALDDDALVAALLADLGETMGLRGGPVAVRVSRWPRSFPQYLPGHLTRLELLDADLAEHAPGVVIAGAGLRGVGIPACIRQGREAGKRVIGLLGGTSDP